MYLPPFQATSILRAFAQQTRTKVSLCQAPEDSREQSHQAAVLTTLPLLETDPYRVTARMKRNPGAWPSLGFWEGFLKELTSELKTE